MDRQTIIYITIAVYMLVMLTVGILNSRSSKSISDFTVGNRNAGAWVSALSYGTAYFSAVMFIGYSGSTGWAYGIWGVLPGLGNAIFGSLLAWLLLADKTRVITKQHNIRSMPQFFEKRYSDGVMKLFCVFVIFIFLIPYSASVYKGLSSVCNVLLGINEITCMVIIAVVSALLVVLSGYAGSLKADFVQGIIMFVGVIALIFVVVRSEEVGGLSTGLANITAETDKLGLTAKDHIALWATVLMTSFGTWGLPQMIHKYYAIKDRAEVKRGIVISSVFALVIAGGGYFIGSLSHLFFSELPEGGKDYIIPNMLSIANIPDVLLGVVLVVLLAASVSTLSSITITAASTFTMDFVQTKVWKKLSPSGASVFVKCLCGVFILLSFIVANTKTPILDMMSYSWGVISGSFMAPYFLALYYKKLNRIGAWAGIISGFIISVPPVICKLFIPTLSIPYFGQIQTLGPHFATVAMIASLIACVVATEISNKSGHKSNDAIADFYKVG